jgi:hypothetical protein
MRVGNDFGICKDRAGKVYFWGKNLLNCENISAAYESHDAKSAA